LQIRHSVRISTPNTSAFLRSCTFEENENVEAYLSSWLAVRQTFATALIL